MDRMTDQRLRRFLSDRQGGHNQAIEARLRGLLEALSERNIHALGYPMAKDFSYDFLSDFIDLPLNNLGDPYVDGRYGMHTKAFEREAVDFYARYFRAPADDYWGYLTTGGTEGNLYALSVAREILPDAVVLHSAASHYSVGKACRLLRLPHREVATQPSGEIDYAGFARALAELGGCPAIVAANIGTTMTEAKDDVLQLKALLDAAGIERHIHADAAFCGPFLHYSGYAGGFDFEHGVDSVAFSAHKFIGAPMPCGIVLLRKSASERARGEVAYIGGVDSTLTGSRNALGALCLWFALQQWGGEGLARRYRDAEAKAAWLQASLRDVGIDAWRNPHALTVVFGPVQAEIESKWQLAGDGVHTHAIVTPHLPMDMLDAFVEDMQGYARGR
jgi:histidine decarboxylase